MKENATALLNALPHPVFTLDAEDGFVSANAAAEVFFSTSSAGLTKRTLSYYVARNSPALALVEQVRATLVPVNEYKVDLSSPRLGGERWMDIYVAPFGDEPGTLMVMLQVRTFAAALDNQLHHRGAARTVTGLAAMLGHEIKNPLSGIRGAAQLLEHSVGEDERALTRLITEETDRIVRLVDRMEVFSNERPITRDQVNIHSVFDHVLNVARQGFARDITIVELYDPSLPPVYGNRDQLVQVFLNLVKNACEAMNGRTDRTLTMLTAFRPGIRIAAAGSTAARVAADLTNGSRHGAGRAGRYPRPDVRSVHFVQAERLRPRVGAGCENRRRSRWCRFVQPRQAPHRLHSSPSGLVRWAE